MQYVVAEKHRFDLIITDLMMPGLDGIAFLAAVKTVFPHTPVLLITAFGTWDTYSEALRKGAFSCLTKPVSTQQLLLIVERALLDRKSTRLNSSHRT